MQAWGEGVKNLKLWTPAIINHLYWTSASTPKEDPDVMEADWQSKVHHVHNIHELHTPAFPYSAHPPLEGDATNKGMSETRYKMLCTIWGWTWSEVKSSVVLVKTLSDLSLFQSDTNLNQYQYATQNVQSITFIFGWYWSTSNSTAPPCMHD